jgi:hypothetical protein
VSKLKIIERGLNRFTVCPRCTSQFESKLLKPSEAAREIREKFGSHGCRREDVSQAADRIVREAPENPPSVK